MPQLRRFRSEQASDLSELQIGPLAKRKASLSNAKILYQCAGGTIVLPAQGAALADRGDGGNLIVNPPHDVWERHLLNVDELTAWAHLISATGEAMLALPQLEGGCINYWEAGNWALNHAAPPAGPKRADEHRSVHMHLIGRSRSAKSPDHVWGEAPRFPAYDRRQQWAERHALLTADECAAIVTAADDLLRRKFGMHDRAAWSRCAQCNYPAPNAGHAC